ncbi:molybdate ABC transporter permease subunit [bacterium 210820-DFI.6.37]|nr:molybdate ABC transporter permease subunit [bacterium 210820-DFI.6.37]
MFGPVLLSLKVATIATVFAFILGVFFAYILTKKRIPGKSVWETILILPMVLPPSIVGYLLLKVFGKRGLIGAFLLDTFGLQIVFTWIACVIAACVVALPLMYQGAKAAFQSVDETYELAAQTLGSSQWKVFWTVLFPLARPGIVSGIVLTFARAMGEFGATLMLAGNIEGQTQTIPTAIYYAVATGKEEQANTLVMVMTLFSFLMIFILNAWLKKKNYKV